MAWLGIDISTWLAIIETALKVSVAVFGAGWAVLLFVLLRKRAEADARIKALEFQIRKQVSVSADIQVDLSSASQEHIVIATVALTNHGNEATKIAWAGQPPAFTVRHVTFDEEGTGHHGPARDFQVMSTRDPSAPALSHIVRPGAGETLTFAFQP